MLLDKNSENLPEGKPQTPLICIIRKKVYPEPPAYKVKYSLLMSNLLIYSQVISICFFC